MRRNPGPRVVGCVRARPSGIKRSRTSADPYLDPAGFPNAVLGQVNLKRALRRPRFPSRGLRPFRARFFEGHGGHPATAPHKDGVADAAPARRLSQLPCIVATARVGEMAIDPYVCPRCGTPAAGASYCSNCRFHLDAVELPRQSEFSAAQPDLTER